ncbi:MAG: dTDP-4-dehydrorhamnose reductase [Chloroflexi bacterium]|nr:dTDP-4-dehydrorhamnose reductase [Chloroflexota bacterium]
MRILVTGARGQLGRELQRTLAEDDVLAVGHSEMNVTDRGKVMEVISDFEPEIVVHSAAYTNVDGCELNPDLAYQVNALGTQNVALAAAAVGAALVYISTDYVFDGQKGAPYLEFDDRAPINIYGHSKLAGERYVQMTLSRFYIVRTAWLYGEGTNFVRTILALADSRKELQAVTDEIGSPTYAMDLAEAIGELIRHPAYGVYHLTNEGNCSRHEFMSAICEAANKRVALIPVTAEEFLAKNPLPARRPKSSALRNFCASTSLGIKLRPWREALDAFIFSEELVRY